MAGLDPAIHGSQPRKDEGDPGGWRNDLKLTWFLPGDTGACRRPAWMAASSAAMTATEAPREQTEPRSARNQQAAAMRADNFFTGIRIYAIVIPVGGMHTAARATVAAGPREPCVLDIPDWRDGRGKIFLFFRP